MLPEKLRLNRRANGVADYLNARIYVADTPTSEEIAAAANIAARLAFDVNSIDLPIGFAISRYNDSESTVAIIVGTAALPFVQDRSQTTVLIDDGNRQVLAIPDVKEAEQFSRSLGSNWVIANESREHVAPGSNRLSLSTIFGSEGVLSENRGRHFPELDSAIIVLAPHTHPIEVIDLAARIAHEAASIRLPMVVADSTEPRFPHAIAVGYDLSNQPGLQPGEGRIAVLDSTAGFPAVSIDSADDTGLSQALKHAAERLPFVWSYGKNFLHLSHIETDLRRFFECRSPAGQVAAALCKSRTAVSKLTPQELKSAKLEILADGDCRPCLNYIASQFPGLAVSTENLNVQNGPLIFEDSFSMPWEGADARRRIRDRVIPKIRPGSRVEVNLRLSESPEVRETLAAEIRKVLLAAGADAIGLKVQILSSHKQAYSWIDECLKSKMANAKKICVFYRGTTGGSASLIEDENRWLHELYPIDEVLSRDLQVPVDNITFARATSDANATYEVVAEDKEGHVFLRETFEPKFVVRPMFDAIPEYANVRVSTGWIFVSVDGAVVVDDRIETDTERFWNHYQSSTLPKIRDYVLHLYGGQPRPKCAPHFGVLEVEVTLSEPDYRIGIGEERISTLEALHEDIYFESLLFMELMGLNNSGRIIPRIRRSSDGKDGSALIRFTGKAGPNPRIQLTWNNSDGRSCEYTEGLLPISNGTPIIQSLVVRSGQASVALEISGVAASEENLALFSAIREFHQHGVEPSWLSYENVEGLRLGPVEIPQAHEYSRHPQIEPLPAASESIVQWETPIDPEECEGILRNLATFPEVHPYHAGTSYLGRPIWCLDVVAPLKGKFVSQAKASISKPVLLITGRQHANEVSSTSHILKLAELLSTDAETRKLLDRVHVVLHPMTNPDGAALVDELRCETPDFMLHAGYLGALGTDVTSEQWSENPLLPEARVRPALWKAWLPDVIFNPHGYPSHEWVQLFAGYTAWVKSRSVTARDWWIPRGWFIPRFEFMEQSQGAAHRLKSVLTESLRSSIGDWNSEMYRRYLKYAVPDPTAFHANFSNNVLVYDSPSGLKQSSSAFTFMQRYPQITLLETVTEVPDEVAHGTWLQTIAQSGLNVSLSCLRYLAENQQPVERIAHVDTAVTKLRILRKRP